MNFESVFIVTYGRTGSTLLMGILNEAPGMLVRGENMNFCAGLYASYKSLVGARQKGGNDSTLPFYGADRLSEETFFNDARRLLRHQIVAGERKEVACWGFKEIRYTPAGLSAGGEYQLRHYLDFLERLGPRPAFIFLTRKHEDVAASAFWQEHEKGRAIGQMVEFEREGMAWSSGRENAFWIDYTEVVERGERLRALFSFLGAEFSSESIERVSSREHSYAGKPENLGNAERRESERLSIQTTAPAGIIAKLDRVPRRVRRNAAFDVGGLMLPLQGGEGMRVTVDGVREKGELRLGMSTPWMKEQHPAVPGSGTARFEIKGMQLDASETAVIACELPSGERHEVFRVKLAK